MENNVNNVRVYTKMTKSCNPKGIVSRDFDGLFYDFIVWKFIVKPKSHETIPRDWGVIFKYLLANLHPIYTEKTPSRYIH
jgi:hypothetical protein